MENKDWREEFKKIEVHYHTNLGRPNAFSEPLLVDDEQEKAIISFIESLLKSKQEEIEKVKFTIYDGDIKREVVGLQDLTDILK